jgi:hypothetical protein
MAVVNGEGKFVDQYFGVGQQEAAPEPDYGEQPDYDELGENMVVDAEQIDADFYNQTGYTQDEWVAESRAITDQHFQEQLTPEAVFNQNLADWDAQKEAERRQYAYEAEKRAEYERIALVQQAVDDAARYPGTIDQYKVDAETRQEIGQELENAYVETYENLIAQGLSADQATEAIYQTSPEAMLYGQRVQNGKGGTSFELGLVDDVKNRNITARHLGTGPYEGSWVRPK